MSNVAHIICASYSMYWSTFGNHLNQTWMVHGSIPWHYKSIARIIIWVCSTKVRTHLNLKYVWQLTWHLFVRQSPKPNCQMWTHTTYHLLVFKTTIGFAIVTIQIFSWFVMDRRQLLISPWIAWSEHSHCAIRLICGLDSHSSMS